MRNNILFWEFWWVGLVVEVDPRYEGRHVYNPTNPGEHVTETVTRKTWYGFVDYAAGVAYISQQYK